MKFYIPLALLAAVCSAGPVNLAANQCAEQCSDDSAFGFTVGNKYDYDYTTIVQTEVAGASEHSSDLQINCRASLEVVSTCDIVLKLSNIRLRDTTPGTQEWDGVPQERAFRMALQRSPLKFGYANGQVTDVCPSSEDDTWVVNFKRGILSHLQTTTHTTDITTKRVELDVNGECDVRYSVKRSGNGQTVTKNKNLNSCLYRREIDSIFQAVPYITPSKVQSLPVLKSKHGCVQRLDASHVIRHSSCNETHTLRAFSSGMNGMTSTINTRLVLQNTETSSASASRDVIEIRKSILFDHDIHASHEHVKFGDATLTLGELCAATESNMQNNAPGIYLQLIDDMKGLDKDQLLSLIGSDYCPNAGAFVADALATVGTTASVEAIATLVLNGHTGSGLKNEIWLTSIAFIGKPDVEMLKSLKPLLLTETINVKAYLAVSALVHSYCKHHDDCESTPIVQDILSLVTGNLGQSCKTEKNSGQTEKIIASLKALGNMGQASSSAVETLNRCASSEENRAYIRIFALNAFRRMSCDADRSEIKLLIENEELDPEIRIQAYLAAMKCPCKTFLGRINNMLERERSNQVGSFIWTHLTNLKEAASPVKQAIYRILHDEFLKTEFDLDKRKFSRNMEWSGFSETANVGATLDNNLVWSHKSFVPRSASVNLTVDLFGHSINVLETGLRVEGVEPILEEMFAGKSANEVFGREKRSTIKDDHLNAYDDEFTAGRQKRPSASFFIRMFGNEIRYGTLGDLGPSMSNMNIMRMMAGLSQKQQIDIAKAMTLLNHDFCVSTIAGLPLVLNLKAAVISHLQMSGKVDLGLGASTPSVDVHGNIRPSAALEIRGDMHVSAMMAKSGMRVQGNIRSSTVTDGKISLKDGNKFTFDVNMPQEELNFVHAESKFFVHHRDEHMEQEMLLGNRVNFEHCTDEGVQIYTGLKMCGKLAFPRAFQQEGAPWFPLTGPASAELTLHKSDSHTGYHFETSFSKMQDVPMLDHLKISMSTPGSQVDRELTLDYNLDRASTSASVLLKTPWVKSELSGVLQLIDAKKTIELRCTIDDVQNYVMEGELSTTVNTHNTVYDGRLTTTLPDKGPYSAVTNVVYRPGRKIQSTLTINNVFETPIKFSSEVNLINNKKVAKTRYEVDVNMELPIFNGNVDFFYEKHMVEGIVYTSRFEVEYQLQGSSSQKVVLNGQVKNLSDSTKINAEVTGAMTTTFAPHYNFDVTSAVVREPQKTISIDIAGGFPQNTGKRATFQLTGNNKSMGSTIAADGVVTLVSPIKDIDLIVRFDHSQTAVNMVHSHVIQYVKNKQIETDIDLNVRSMNPLNVISTATIKYPGHVVIVREETFQETGTFKQKLNVNMDGNSLVAMTASYTPPGKRYNVTKYTKPGAEMWHEADANINVTAYTTQPIVVHAHLNPNLNHIEELISVTYEGNEYAIGSKFANGRNGDKYTCSNDVTLKCPHRWVTFSQNVTKKGNEFEYEMETKWDAGRDPMERFRTVGELTLSPVKPRIHVRTDCHHTFVDVTGSFDYDKKGWWSIHRELIGHVDVVTSFEGNEKMNFMFKHDQDPKTAATHAELDIGNNQKFIGDFYSDLMDDWNHVNHSMSLVTPFPEIQRVSHALQYRLKGDHLTADHAVTYNGKAISTKLVGRLQPQNIETTLSIKTPFPHYKSMIYKVKHTKSGNMINTDVALGGVRGYQATASFQASHNRRGWFITNNGALRGNAQYNGKEQNFELNWMHNNNKNIINCQANMKVNEKEGKIAMIANRAQFGGKGLYSLHSRLTTPFEAVQDMKFNINHTQSQDFRDIDTNVVVQWAPGMQISAEHKIKLTQAQLSHIAEVRTPFPDYEHMTYSLLSNLSPYSLSANLETKKNSHEMITVQLNAEYEDEFTSLVTFRVTTPFKGYERFYMKNKREKIGEIYVTTTDTEYPSGLKYRSVSKFGFLIEQIFSYELTSPNDPTAPMMFLTTFDGQPDKFQAMVKFNHNKFSKPIDITLDVDVRDVNTYDIALRITTPFEPASVVQCNYGHLFKNGNYSGTFAFESPVYRMKATGKGHMSPRSNINNFVLEYMPGKKIEIDVKYLDNDANVIAVELSTPFEMIKNALFKYKLKIDQSGFSGSTEVKYAWSTKAIAGGVTLSKRGNDIRFNLTVTTPFEGYLRNELKMVHQGAWNDFENTMDLLFRKVSHRLTSNFALTGDNLDITVVLNTEYPQIQTVTLRMNHMGGYTNFKQQFSITYGNNKKIELSTELSRTRRGINGNAQFSTPFAAVRSIIAEFEHSGKLNNFKNSGSVVYNDQTYSMKSNFKHNRFTTIIGLELTGPSADVITFTHKGSLKDFANKAEVLFKGTRYSVQSAFEKSGNSIKANVSVKIPDEYSFGVTHSGVITNFRNSAQVTIKENTYTGNSEFSYSGDTINALARVNVHGKAYSVELNHQGSIADFTTHIESSIGGAKYIADITNKFIGGRLESTIVVKTPHPGYELTNIVLAYKPTRAGLEVTTTYNSPSHPLVKHVKLLVRHTGTRQGFNTIASVIYDGKKIQADVDYKLATMTPSGYWLQINFKSPFAVVRSIEITSAHNADANTARGTLNLSHNEMKYMYVSYDLKRTIEGSIEVEFNVPPVVISAMGIHPAGEVSHTPYSIGLKMSNENQNRIKREISLATNCPDHKINVSLGYTRAEEQLFHHVCVIWGDEPTDMIMVNLNRTRRQEGNQHIKDGELNIHTPAGMINPKWTHAAVPGRKYETRIVGKEWTLTNILAVSEPPMREFTSNMTIQHTKISGNININMAGIIKPEIPHFEGSVAVSHKTQNLKFSGKIANETTSHNNRLFVLNAHLEHPNSNTDIFSETRAYNNREKRGITKEARYMLTGNKKMKIGNVRMEINKLKKQFEFQTTTPFINGEFTINKIHTKGKCHHDITGKLGKSEINGHLEFLWDEPGFDLHLHDKKDNNIHMYARMLSPTLMQFELNHDINDNHVQDAFASLNLNTSRLLHTRLHLRPSLYRDIKMRMAGAKTKGSRWWAGVSRIVMQESAIKRRAMLQSANQLKSIPQTFAADWAPMRAKLDYFYKNHPTLKKICSWAKTQKATIRNAMGAINWSPLGSGYGNVSYVEFMAQTRRRHVQAIADWRDSLDRFGERAVSWLRERYGENPNMGAVVDSAFEWFSEKASGWFSYLKSHPALRIFRLLRPYHESYNEFKHNAHENWKKFVQNPHISPLKKFVQAYINEDFDVDFYTKARERWVAFQENGPHRVLNMIANRLKQTFQFEKTQLTVWDPSTNELQFEVYLPVSVVDIEHLGSFPQAVTRWYKRIEDSYKNMLPEDGFSFWDNYYKYKPSDDVYAWFPPYPAHASMAGQQHFMTFDKKFYEFAGQCSYLLARDHVDGTFSVVVNYLSAGPSTPAKKSITVVAGSNQIEILPNFKILVNDRQSDMPLSLEETWIRRIGHLVQIDSSHGVTVSCDLPHDRCTVNVTGWYHGKIGGLLGTYDNEVYNDAYSPSGSEVSYLGNFADSWSVGPKCRADNIARISTAAAHSGIYRTCARYFMDEQSPFRVCFKQVDHEQFQQMCINELSAQSNSLALEENVCNVAAFYVDECTRHQVPIRMPKHCVSCDRPTDGLFFDYETLSLNDDEVPQSADVVLVVSQESCNIDVVEKLADLVTMMDKSFKGQGMGNVRFGLVGYGGEGIFSSPHSHTMEGSLFNNRHKFQDIISSLPISSDKKSDDSLAAIRFAARYPFRAGVSKTMVLIPCHKCYEQSVGYAELQSLLLNRDIRLTTLMQHQFSLSKDSRKSSTVYGADQNGVYTQKHVGGDLVPDKSLKSQVRLPKDLCVALTEETGGAIFNSLFMVEGGSTSQKKFLDVMTRVAAQNSVPSSCQLCDCMPEQNTGVGIATCRACQTRDPLYMFPPEFELEGGFGYEDDAMNPPKHTDRTTSRKPKSRKTKKDSRRTRNRKVKQM